MKSEKRFGKRVVLGILLIGIIVISISFVSASWKDWFGFGDDKNLEGELPESATATVELGLPANPPTIVFVSNLSLPLGAGIPITLGKQDTISFNFTATINFTGGCTKSNLPGSGQVIMGTNMRANFSNAAQITTETTYEASCVWVADTPLACGDGKNYTCTITKQFYDTPFTDWNISVQMSTMSDNTNWGMVNKTSRFRYAITPNVDILSPIATPPTNLYLNWSALQLNDVNKLAVFPDYLILNNTGNVKMAQNGINVGTAGNTYYFNLRINSTNLTGDAGDIIMPGNFTGNALSAYPSPVVTTICNSVSKFIHLGLQNVSVTVEKGFALYNYTYFCLNQIPKKSTGAPFTVPQVFRTSDNLNPADQYWTLAKRYGGTPT